VARETNLAPMVSEWFWNHWVNDRKHRARLAATLMALASPLFAVADDEISSYAFVQDDGSMRIGGELVRLYGVYIPPSGQTCYEFTRPLQCGSRASLALDFKIGAEFVRCKLQTRNPDGSAMGFCTARGEDLAAFMLQSGWALALPDAPFEYAALEKIAQSRGVGVWGIPIDRPRR
jgi:endonuclease YncB( thermonuclease family)